MIGGDSEAVQSSNGDVYDPAPAQRLHQRGPAHVRVAAVPQPEVVTLTPRPHLQRMHKDMSNFF